MSDPVGGVRCDLDADGLLMIWIDVPGKPVNTLSTATWDGLDAAVGRIERDRPAGVIIASAKTRSFVAGADLFELREMSDDALDRHLDRGQRILDRLEATGMPTVAAINGDTLGGGLELALACRFRVAADDPRSRLGLPETTLGLVPGWGGTFRLPRLIGLERALALMVPGKTVPPSEALAMGMVDSLTTHERLIETARELVTATPAPRAAAVAQDAASRDELIARFRRSTRERSGDHLPAPLRLLDIVTTGCGGTVAEAEAAERRGLIEMRATPAGRNLMRLFFLKTAAKKTAAAEAGGTSRPVRSAVVLGGGTMGAGIAAALAGSGIEVQVIEADRLSAEAAAARLAKAGSAAVPVVTDWSAAATADLVIEAIVEALPEKLAAFRRLDGVVRPDAILATNTSSLSVSVIAAAMSRPGRVIGLHFFNPVARMPLVEVVRTPYAEADAVATGVAVAAALGKTPIVCGDRPGFVVNRVLFPYLREAIVRCPESGVEPYHIDAELRAWGMPMGPFLLMDEIGLDVTTLIFESLAASFGPRLAPPAALVAAVSRGWLGKKSGRGFYDHGPEGPLPNPQWRELFAGGGVRADFAHTDTATALVDAMAAEARFVLGEKVVATADAIDLATVLGIGFPAFRGGLATCAGLAS